MNDDLIRIPMTRLAAIALLLSQVGCASLQPPNFLDFGAKAESPTESQQIELQIAFAQAAERRGDTEQAIASYKKLVENNQATADVHHRMALIYDRKGESEQAEGHYLESLKLKPDQAKVLCDYGYSLYLRESLELAEAQYQKAIEADPQYVRSHVNLGMLLARTDRFDEALQQFALGGLSEAEAHHNVALAATQNGNSQIAVTALELSQQADQGGKTSGNRQALKQMVHRIAARQAN